MKKFFRILFTVLIAAFLLIQFYPRPEKNNGNTESEQDISKVINTPAPVLAILKTSCYDCHSNQTYYPWYAQIQPVALWLNDHIEEGKKELNFTLFGQYPVSKQYRKLEEIGEMVQEDEMPLVSYTLIHRNAKLDESQKQTLLSWVGSARKYFQNTHSPETLERKP
jgi:hypothetical protein